MNAQQTKRWRIRVARHGKDRVPTVDLRRHVSDLRSAGWTVTAIAAHVGVTEQALSYSCCRAVMVHRLTAAAVHRLWVDYCGPVTVCDRRWPVAPLRAAIDRRWPLEGRRDGSGCTPPWSETDRCYLYRVDSLDEVRAERVCISLGLNVEDVWPDWFDLEASA